MGERLKKFAKVATAFGIITGLSDMPQIFELQRGKLPETWGITNVLAFDQNWTDANCNAKGYWTGTGIPYAQIQYLIDDPDRFVNSLCKAVVNPYPFRPLAP